MVAIVVRRRQFLGLITRIDLINYLRRGVLNPIEASRRDQPIAATRIRPGFATRAIHAGQAPDPTTGAVMTPIYATSTYVQQSPGRAQGLRLFAQPQPDAASPMSAASPTSKSGTHGFAFASGMAATATVLELLDAGAHVVAMRRSLRRHYRLFERVRRRSRGPRLHLRRSAPTRGARGGDPPETRR